MGCSTSISEGVVEVIGGRDSNRGRQRISGETGMATIFKEEWGIIHCRVNVIIIGELGRSKPGVPVSLGKIGKQTEVLLEVLVYTFGLTISLGMIGSREGGLNSE